MHKIKYLNAENNQLKTLYESACNNLELNKNLISSITDKSSGHQSKALNLLNAENVHL